MGSSQNRIVFRGHFYAFWGLFLRSRRGMRVFLGVAKISILFGVLEIPDFFFFFFFFFLGGGGGANG